ncbi:MAG: NrtA/SsuA/CpmA family ABC transporter substrate-binding protein [Chloroflexi bacterium]|nr:NrtA/SsuA/CpmA family ABC transporter substrate-binding protein [Chloroflexota bacterium]
MQENRSGGSNRFVLATIVLIILLALVLGCSPGLIARSNPTGTVESIRIAIFPYETNTLIYIAQEQDYFAAEGLDVTIKNYASVTGALNGMLNGESDLSVASEFVLVGKAFRREDIRALASIDKFVQISIVARKDRGIKNISDLAGKKIGVFKTAVSEFYLGRFLELHGMNVGQVTLYDTSSSDIVAALTNGTVDAVVTGQPNIDRIGNNLGREIVVWSAQSNQPAYYNVYSAGRWASDHPEMVKRFLNSLVRAENYLIANPDAAKTLIQERLNYSAAYIASIWPEHQFSVTLERGLVAAMEDQARWMINNNLTTEKKAPNFSDYIYVDGLKQVKPNAVNIFQ